MSRHGTPNNLSTSLATILQRNMEDDRISATTEIESMKQTDPLRATDIILAIQMERMRVVEASSARDVVVQRLEDAYTQLRQKSAIADRLEHELAELKKLPMLCQHSSIDTSANPNTEIQDQTMDDEIIKLRGIVRDLQDQVKLFKDLKSESARSVHDPPPTYEEGRSPVQDGTPGCTSTPPQCSTNEHVKLTSRIQAGVADTTVGSPFLQSNGSFKTHGVLASPLNQSLEMEFKSIGPSPNLSLSEDPEEMIAVRHAKLVVLPLPYGIPEDALRPITIPPPLSLHEFLSTASGSFKNFLSNYRVLQQLTTWWCPEREEHGYFLTPVFKCSTNPRVATAHRWAAVDVIGKMNKDTECFYNKDGKCYYAGVYLAFRMDDLTVQEWEALSPETTQAIVKETIAGRKNISPQNLYEASQLYAAGALKVACIGLQCVGFNNPLYRTVLEQANKTVSSPKWRSPIEGDGHARPVPVGNEALWDTISGINASTTGIDSPVSGVKAITSGDSIGINTVNHTVYSPGHVDTNPSGMKFTDDLCVKFKK